MTQSAWAQVYSRCETLEKGSQSATAAGEVAMDEDTGPSAAQVQEQQVRVLAVGIGCANC